MNNIKELRQKLGLSQKQFGEVLGVSKQSVSSYENGLTSPTFGKIAKAVETLRKQGHNISYDDFFVNNFKQAS